MQISGEGWEDHHVSEFVCRIDFIRRVVRGEEEDTDDDTSLVVVASRDDRLFLVDVDVDDSDTI